MVCEFLNILFPELRSACLYNNVFEIISVQMFKSVKQMYECVHISACVFKKKKFCCLAPYQPIPRKQLTCERADGLARPSSIKRMPTPDAEYCCNVILCKNMYGSTTTVALCNNGCTVHKKKV